MEKLNSTTYKKEVKNNPKDRIEVIIGDDKQLDFKPQVKIQRWDNEVNFSMRAEEKPNARIEEKKGVIKYITTDYEVHQYEKLEAGEDGGFEFEWVLNKKPESNILRTTIQTKGLDFFYQPELTQEEINRGAERPENVIGSYAVYHKTKKNNIEGEQEYKTGKFCHIYRPKAIDKNGVETWCELNIDEEAGELTVTVPQEFLDNASYSVVVDPTFGYTSTGGSITYVSSGSDTRAPGMKSGSALAGTLTAITAYMRVNSSTGGDYSWCFADTQPNATWNKYQNYSPVSLSTTPAWVSKTGLSIAFSGASNAYVGIQLFYSGGAGSNPGVFYDTSAGTNGMEVSEAGSYSDTNTINNSVYATYTASASFTPTPMLFMMAQSGGLM